MKLIPPLVPLLLSAPLLFAEDPGKPLKVGDPVPELTLRTDKNKEFNLRREVAGKPAVLIFYRGGWCPYCTQHLSGLSKIEGDLTAAGFQLLAISPDQPAKLREKPDHQALSYTLLSDSTMAASRAFGIAFEVPDDVLTKYKGYGIDLEAASGQTHHLLPHPAVFVVDKEGVVRFAHVNPDYKSRLDPAKVLEAAAQRSHERRTFSHRRPRQLAASSEERRKNRSLRYGSRIECIRALSHPLLP